MEQRQVTNAVRQTIINELGMTRQSIRDEVTATIQAEVEKAISTYLSSESFKDVILKTVNRVLTKSTWYAADNVQKEVSAAINSEVAKFVQDEIRSRVNIGIELTDQANLGARKIICK